MVTLYIALPCLDTESATDKLNGKVPAEVGVPETAPSADNANPGGIEPAPTEYVYGALPMVAAIEAL
jgi:hypothetical protein